MTIDSPSATKQDEPWDRQRAAYFRRLLWVCSRLSEVEAQWKTKSAPSTSVVALTDDIATQYSEGHDRRVFKNLSSFVNLCLRQQIPGRKVVGVATRTWEVLVIEELDDGDTKNEAKRVYDCVCPRNREADVYRALQMDERYTWLGRSAIQTTMEPISLTDEASQAAPGSPDASFPAHISKIHLSVQVGEESHRLQVYVYLMRSCFPSIAERIEKHLPAMSDEEEREHSKLGDYGPWLFLPAYNDTTIIESVKSIFKDTGEWGIVFNDSVSRIYDSNGSYPPGRSSIFSRSLNDRSFGLDLTSPIFQQAVTFCNEYIFTAPEPVTYADLHSILSTLTLCFFAGIKTLRTLGSSPKYADLWKRFEARTPTDIFNALPELWRALQIVGLSAGYLSELLREPDSSKFVMREYIAQRFGYDNVYLTCLEWLKATTEHFASYSNLLLPSGTKYARGCSISVMDMQHFSEHEQIQSMVSLEEFFATFPQVDQYLFSSSNKRSKETVSIMIAELETLPSSPSARRIHTEAIILLLYLLYRTRYPLPPRLLQLAKLLDPNYLASTSKLCPVCEEILDLVQVKTGARVMHPKPHGLWTEACELPAWCPRWVADEVVTRVESRLRSEYLWDWEGDIKERLYQRREWERIEGRLDEAQGGFRFVMMDPNCPVMELLPNDESGMLD
ncbi:hypothetical protein BJ508DRAFT_312187 [Ascobolus immersus RN42]|uniref:Uncharacterized protein n=1 Tax=Ascobolus immersus RN42 TaxID=1160509 RepID=A0A3N4HT90_ASCIM|nr:hypothetical protein BJ508DRAFT_312187 [Ascobolus immersus RN42]